MAPACCTRGILGGGGCPPPVSPRCHGHAYYRSVLSWRSASLPIHYTPQLGSASAPPLSGTPPSKSWACQPLLPLLLPVLQPPFTRCAMLGSAQTVTPSPGIYRTCDIWTANSIYPCSTAPPLSSSGYSLHLPIPRPLGMDGIPSPLFFVHLYSTPPDQINPSACQMQSRGTPGWWRVTSCCLHRITQSATLTAYAFPPSDTVCYCVP